eukprot:scaffold620_cov103-Cylindrotheca_fusiformis.AAC.3
MTYELWSAKLRTYELWSAKLRSDVHPIAIASSTTTTYPNSSLRNLSDACAIAAFALLCSRWGSSSQA